MPPKRDSAASTSADRQAPSKLSAVSRLKLRLLGIRSESRCKQMLRRPAPKSSFLRKGTLPIIPIYNKHGDKQWISKDFASQIIHAQALPAGAAACEDLLGPSAITNAIWRQIATRLKLSNPSMSLTTTHRPYSQCMEKPSKPM